MNATQALHWITLAALMLTGFVAGIAAYVIFRYRAYIVRAISDKPHKPHRPRDSDDREREREPELLHSR